ncbi:MAG: leucyl aminopeptidase [Myxococcota bacterium]
MTMRMTMGDLKTFDATDHQTDLLVLSVFATAKEPDSDGGINVLDESSVATAIARALGVDLAQEMATCRFTGKPADQLVLHTLGKIPARYVAVVGLGEQEGNPIPATEAVRRAAGRACRIAQQAGCQSVTLCLPEKAGSSRSAVAQAAYEGMLLADYRFDRYRTKEDTATSRIEELTVVVPDPIAEEERDRLLSSAAGVAKGVCVARDLVNMGAGDLTPRVFAQEALQRAQPLGLEVDVLDEHRLERERLRMMLAVGGAASVVAPPRLIRLAYRPPVSTQKPMHVVLVGKGLTFDSGGLDLKPSAGMRDMKMDMAGAACVLGTVSTVAELKLPVTVTGYLACAENGIGARAYHPGDVLRSRKGLTVEVDNTDAEGRLVLADAIDYACERDRPDMLIDVATLTGACMVALGQRTAGLYSTPPRLADRIQALALEEGESCWPLPLTVDDQLDEELRSTIADVKNCGGRYGGSITAALFLRNFVPASVRWLHMDIAGPAFAQKESATCGKGGTGFGVRTLVRALTQPELLEGKACG